MSSTVYDIRLKYSADDSASGKLNNIGRAADRANNSGLNLRNTLVAIGGSAGLVAGKKLLVDYNVQMEKMKVGMGAVLAMQMKKPFSEARKEADMLILRLQEVAKKSPGTTKEFAEMANQIAPMVALMGGGIDKIQSMSAGAVIAAQATGTRADSAAMDIKQMLAGKVGGRDMMANQLIASQGLSLEQFNALSGKERATLTEKALNDPALKKAADEFGASFEGTMSTFQDGMAIAFGKIGLPLMKDITKEVSKWNTWIERNPVKIAMFSKMLTNGLSKTFEFLKSTAEFFVNHSETLITIAKAFAIFKVGSIVGASLNSITSGLTNFGRGLAEARSGFATLLSGGAGSGGLVKGFMSLMGALGPVTMALGGLAAAAYALWNIFGDKSNEERKKNKDFVMTAFGEDIMKDQDRRSKLKTMQEQLDFERRIAQRDGHEGYDRNGKAIAPQMDRVLTEIENIKKRQESPERQAQAAQALRAIYENGGSEFMSDDFKVDAERLRRFGKSGGIPAQALSAMRALAGRDPNARNYTELDTSLDLSKYHRLAYPDQYAKEADPMATEWKDIDPEKTNVNITINKIEVASDDPDRFVFGAVKAFEKAAKNPTQAATTIPGGF